MSAALVLKFWREGLIALLVLGLVASCVSRDHRIEAGAVARAESHQADSVLKVVTPQFVIHDTLVVHDTVQVRVAVNRLVTFRDTVLRHLTDTVLVKEYVTRADSVARACTELSNDCAAFRVYATRTIAALKQKASAAPIIGTKSCVGPSLITGTLTALTGYLIGARVGASLNHR